MSANPLNPFKKATKKAARLRLGLIGPPGSGKTYSALSIATAMAGLAQAEGPKIAFLDSEFHSSEKYADLFDFDVQTLDESFHPLRYVEGIRAAERNGYQFLIIDSLSHAWIGKDGGLDLHDKAVARQKTKNSYTAWAEVTPHHQQLVQALVQCKCHLIVTLRSKVEYVQEKGADGKTVVRKVGTAPLMRDGLEYEFDVVGDMDDTNTLVITKSRCPALARQVIPLPGRDMAAVLLTWLSDGVPASPPVASNGHANGHGHQGVVTGAALARRIVAKDAQLAGEGKCQVGELVAAITKAGVARGWSAGIEEWPEEGFLLCKSVTLSFEDARKTPAEPARPREPGDDDGA